jgi:hypothetical protein
MALTTPSGSEPNAPSARTHAGSGGRAAFRCQGTRRWRAPRLEVLVTGVLSTGAAFASQWALMLCVLGGEAVLVFLTLRLQTQVSLTIDDEAVVHANPMVEVQIANLRIVDACIVGNWWTGRRLRLRGPVAMLHVPTSRTQRCEEMQIFDVFDASLDVIERELRARLPRAA